MPAGLIPALAEQNPAVGHAAKDAFSQGTRYPAFAAPGFLMFDLLATMRLSGGAANDTETDPEAGPESHLEPEPAPESESERSESAGRG